MKLVNSFFGSIMIATLPSFILMNNASASNHTIRLQIARAYTTVVSSYAEDALKLCQDSEILTYPGHLPTAKELALLASKNCNSVAETQPCGAKGIVEKCDLDKNKNCMLIRVNNWDGTSSSFFYDRTGYRAPNKDLFEIWTSSSGALPHEYGGFTFTLYSGEFWTGTGFYDYYPRKLALACLVEQ